MKTEFKYLKDLKEDNATCLVLTCSHSMEKKISDDLIMEAMGGEIVDEIARHQHETKGSAEEISFLIYNAAKRDPTIMRALKMTVRALAAEHFKQKTA